MYAVDVILRKMETNYYVDNFGIYGSTYHLTFHENIHKTQSKYWCIIEPWVDK